MRRVARVALGQIEGVVVDERGAPLAGVTVSAFGSSNASAITDKRGSFALRALPAGPYLMRAERSGYLPSRRQFVQVAPSGPTRFSVKLLRTGTPGDSPGLLAAGMAAGAEPLSVDLPGTTDDGSVDPEDRSETAWRLRHLKRSILKEAERAAVEGPKDSPTDGIQPGTYSFIARAMGNSAHLLGELPFSGQINLLTSGSFDGQLLTGSSTVPLREVAFVSVGGPAWGHGDWSAQVMAQGDLGSWFLAGSYRKRAPATHLYEVGISHSTQRFTPGSRWPIGSGRDGARSAAAIYGSDEWTLSPNATLSYGARYARYDYLANPGLFSPRLGLTLVPVKGLRLQGLASRRVLAPGAEEFLEPLVSGLWVPPERTFLGLGPLLAERTNHFEVSLQKDLPANYVVTVRSFVQETQNQQVALFAMRPVPTVGSSHYIVGNDGDVGASGWGVGLSNMISDRVRGSIAYTMSSTHWVPGEASDYGLLLIGAGARPQSERVHDLSTAVEADLPVTSTRVFLAYRVNSAFALREADAVKSGVGARFDVQVIQPLPFLDFTSARWQVMLAVRNMFRDTASDASVYDELLVVRPPKRVVTGLLVRF